jgi:DMSO/TMAO reductase YedYZ molybdopterin-dependent catalytic subunit
MNDPSHPSPGGDAPLIVSPDTLRGEGRPGARTPPGQQLTVKWPVLHYGPVPRVDVSRWRLRVWGLVEREVELDWAGFTALPRVRVKCDIHCVTHWSRLDNVFMGVSTRAILDLARPLPEATHVIQHAASEPEPGWTTNLPLADFAATDCLLATHHDGQALTAEHGGPVRVVAPRLYFWKGAKWVTGLELTDADRPGFWEVNGYHMRGDPWREERFGW